MRQRRGAALRLAAVGRDFVRRSGETTPFLQVDKAWWCAASPVCGMMRAARSLAATWRALRGDADAAAQAVTFG